MFKVAKRLISYTHNRDINCFFHGSKVMYSIPLHGRHEAAALGNTLNIEIDLEDIKPSYSLNIMSIREGKVKTLLLPDAPAVYEGCCPKK